MKVQMMVRKITAVITVYIYMMCNTPIWALSNNQNSPGKAVVETIELLVKQSEGGTVSLGGASIEIPPGALKEDTVISITKLTKIADTGDGLYNVTAGGKGYKFGPSGLRFLKEVTIKLPYSSYIGGGEGVLDDIQRQLEGCITTSSSF